MRISTRLKLAAFVPALMALVIGLAMFFSYRAEKGAREKSTIVRQIMSDTNELNSLAHSYMLHHEERPRLQFLIVYDSVIRLTTATRFSNSEQQRLLDGVRHNSETMRNLFLKLVSNYEGAGSAANTALLREAEQRLTGQILTRSRYAVSDAASLGRLIDNEIATNHGRINALVLLLIVTVTFPLTMILIRMTRKINTSLAALRKGTELIASGNLDYRVGTAAGDEIGELAGAFDRMTERLKDTTVSRDALQEEVEERKRAEEALRRMNVRLRLLMDALPVGVTIAEDPDCRVISTNPAAAHMFEAAEAANISASAPQPPPHRYFHEGKELQPEEMPLQMAVFGNREVPEVEMEAHLPSGRQWTGLVSATPLHGSDGKVIGGIAVVRDITERKQAENALRQRTADLEASNRELESYAYSISHDLRTPLRAIHSYSDILVEDYAGVLDEAGKDHLNRICVAVQRMSTLMEAMLSLTHLIKSEPKREEVNLTTMAQEIADELRKAEPERQVDFVIAENVTALADSAMIRAVLDNLLRNAWKFTAKHDKARIEFGTERSGSETIYHVRDDGAGFNMDYADKLFKAFQRLHRPGEYTGTGIGLATVQRIIHRHGGRIWAEGEVEKGATFYFTLGKDSH